jgi:hypothetical protein
VTMPFWKDIAEIAQHAVEVIALLVGGFWTYWRYFKGRTFKPRARLGLRGELFSHSAVSYLHVSVRFQNVGNGKFHISQRGTGLVVSVSNAAASRTGVAYISWMAVAAFPVFEYQVWIEPKESVEEALLLRLPATAPLAWKLELRVVSKGQAWSQSEIVRK